MHAIRFMRIDECNIAANIFQCQADCPINRLILLDSKHKLQYFNNYELR